MMCPTFRAVPMLASLAFSFAFALGAARAQEDDDKSPRSAGDPSAEIAECRRRVLLGDRHALDELPDLLAERPELADDPGVLEVQYLERWFTGRYVIPEDPYAAVAERFPNLDQLVTRLEQVSAARPDLQLQCAEYWRFRGQLDQAEKIANAILEKNPKDAGGRLALARIRGEQGRRSDQVKIAEAAYEDLLGATGRREVWLAGLLAAEVGRLEEATDHLVHAEHEYKEAKDPEHALLLVDLGNLYRLGRTTDGLNAIECYREALKANENLTAARCGLARVQIYRDDSFKAEAEVDAALDRTPNEPEALTLKAHFRISDARFKEALTLIDKALAIAPRSRETLAYQVAALYLRNDPAWKDVRAHLLELDPTYGKVDAILGDMIKAQYRFAEAIPFFKQALERDPEYHMARTSLGQCLAHTGAEAEALRVLDEAAQLDKFPYPWRENMRRVLRQSEKFVDADEGIFHFRMSANDSPVLVPYYRRYFSAYLPKLIEKYGIDPPTPLLITSFSRHADFSVRTIGFSGLGALGVCFGNTITLVSPSSELRGSFVWARTAVHELTHVFSIKASDTRVPRWLTEGLSVYEERCWHPEWDREMDLELYNAYHNDEIFPLRDFNAAFRSSRILFGYYQGGLICEYIAGKHGFHKLVEILGLYAKDKETPEVVELALKCTPEEFDREFLQWLWDTRLKDIRLIPFYSPQKKDAMRAEAIVKKKDADLLARLAFAYARLDNPVDADDYLRRALAIDPENGVALLLSGERKFTRHEFAEAEELYRKAFAHGTEDMFAWLKIAEIHQGDEDTTIEEQALKSAKACFPRYVGPSNAYMQLARFYAKHDRHEDALHELESLCAIDESAFEPRVQLAQGAREAGDRAAQAKWLEQAIEIDPFRRDLHRELGGALRALSRFAEALFELNMALAVDPSMDPKYTPDPAQPLSDEQKALDKSERADIHVEIAELYRLVGDEAKAREAIDDALKLVPDHEQALKLKSAP